MSIKIEHAHFEGQAASSQRPSRRGDSDDAENEAAAAAHPTAERLDGAEPAGGGESVAGEEVRAAEEAKEERHDGVGDLLGARGVDVDEAKAKVSGKGGVDGAVGGAKAEDEVVGTEAALGGAREVGEGVEENRGGRLDLAFGEAAEGNMLYDSDAGKGLELERTVVDAV